MAKKTHRKPAKSANGADPATNRPVLPGQVVLVLQGGGALGAYQAGVYQALHEAGVEPDWVPASAGATPLFCRRPRAGWGPASCRAKGHWMPACAGTPPVPVVVPTQARTQRLDFG